MTIDRRRLLAVLRHMRVWLVVALAGCTAPNGGLSIPDLSLTATTSSNGGNNGSNGGNNGSNGGGGQDLAVVASTDLAFVPIGCTCPKDNYCDLATQTCKPGCAFDTDCTSGHCNQGQHMCFTPGVTCGAKMCTAGQVCCTDGVSFTCASSCATDMGVAAQCTTPRDCGSQVCCARAVIGPSPSCTRTATVQCQSTCEFIAPVGCGTTGQAVICQQKSDCKDAAAANCCTFNQPNFMGTFCVPDSIKVLGTCL